MTNEQLANYLRHIHTRLDEALDTLRLTLLEDLPDNKLLEARIVQPSTKYYPPLEPLESLADDLEQEVRTLLSPITEEVTYHRS